MLLFHEGNHGMFMYVLCEFNPNSSSPVMNETGYGPRSRYGRLLFDGDERKYEQWEVKFVGYMRLRKLKMPFLQLTTRILPQLRMRKRSPS